MKYYIQSVVEYIDQRMKNIPDIPGKRFQVMIPCLPGEATLRLANKLDEYCIAHNYQLVFKVAQEQADNWSKEEKNEASNKNYLASSSLTSIRNHLSEYGQVQLTVLVGSACVPDKGSLTDFHQCDFKNIWINMRKSLRTWVEMFLKFHSIDYYPEDLDAPNEILVELAIRFDILKVSSWLENLTIEGNTIGDFNKSLKENLNDFALPNLIGYSYKAKKNRTFRYYADSANSFFNYEIFMEERKRDSALKKITKYQESDDCNLLDVELGDFESEDEFFSTLKNFIETGSEDDVPQLKKCDFVFIWEKILKYNPPAEKVDKNKLKKLSGSPLEVILQALYITFQNLTSYDIAQIKIEGVIFRHDYPVEDAENSLNAIMALKQLLGGLDDILPRYIQIKCPDMEDCIAIESKLLINTQYEFAKTKEPYFEFKISVDDQEQKMHFAMRLPEIHPYRLANTLISLAAHGFEKYRGDSNWNSPLPVFHLNYYQELMAAKDEEEICRVLLHCLNECRPGQTEFMKNIFTPNWFKKDDALKPFLENIAHEYKQVIFDAKEKGLYWALFNSAQNLINAYDEAINKNFVLDQHCTKSIKLATILMRAFLVIQENKTDNIDVWAVQPYEESCVITILHPCIIEMLHDKSSFLLSTFSTIVTENLSNPHPTFKNNKWQYFVDMAEIQMPLGGMLVDSDCKLNIDVKGKNLLHRIGNCFQHGIPMATSLLTRYDQIDEDDISDAEIFKETRESKLLCRILNEYLVMHPHAQDGITLAVFRNSDVQPVLAALNNFLRGLADKKIIDYDRKQKYDVNLILFSESADDTGITTWLEEWQERWKNVESDDKMNYYSFCQLSIAHRIVSSENNRRQFEKIIRKEIDADIFVFYDFIEAGYAGNNFKQVGEYDRLQNSLKFPILEKSFHTNPDVDEKLKRSQIISNRQFIINSAHTEIMARIKNPGEPVGTYHVILGTGNYAPWQKIIEAAHEASEWVVCIDANIDDKLIKECDNNSYKRREIIGFGSGVGIHGESNYTISTQKFMITDLKMILRNKFKSIYHYGNYDDDEKIINELTRAALQLSGLSLIRALGPSYYICDFLAYSIIYKILPISQSHRLCDKLFSIDAYHHWFDLAGDDKTHPDLLWLRADITSQGRIKIYAKLIECKMCQESAEVLEKAQKQIQNGLDVLGKSFRPRLDDEEVPDGRYWYLQLHRLIACSANLSEDEKTFLAAMERLAAGDFEIKWTAAIFAFWTNYSGSTIEEEDCLEIESNGEDFHVPIYKVGYKFIKNMCCQEFSSPMLSWDDEQGELGEQVQDTDIIEEREPEISEPEEVNDENIILNFSSDKKESNVSIEPEIPMPNHEVIAPVPADQDPNSFSDQNKNSEREIASCHEVSIPDRIFLGKEGDRNYYWEFGHHSLNNRHLLIFGNSGMGKTYAIQAILCELGRQKQNSLIVDYTNGFLPNQLDKVTLEALNPQQRVVKNDKIPIDPFLKQTLDLGGGIQIKNTSSDVAKRVTSIFNSVYHIGDQQSSVLIDAIKSGVDHGDMKLEKLLPILESFLDDEHHKKNTVQSLLSKLGPFISEEPFSNNSDGNWNNIFSNEESLCQIFQLVGMDKETSRILIEFILWDLYAYACNCSTEKTPKAIVLDEVQNLNQDLEAPLGKILTEGRKFGLCLIAATQTLSNLTKDQQARLFQAGHKLFFGPNAPEANQYAELVMQVANYGTKDDWKRRLMSLKKGECYSIGPVLNETTGELRTEVHRIKISALGERGF